MKGGKLILIDIDYPKDRNRIGMMMTRLWAFAGDIIRDMEKYLAVTISIIEISKLGDMEVFIFF